VSQLLLSVVIASIASGIEAGLLGKILGDLLLRTGVLKGFAISR
jgi:ABC-type thiamin/hydroxymethylpyrimidine transport system permease subunit